MYGITHVVSRSDIISLLKQISSFNVIHCDMKYARIILHTMQLR